MFLVLKDGDFIIKWWKEINSLVSTSGCIAGLFLSRIVLFQKIFNKFWVHFFSEQNKERTLERNKKRNKMFISKNQKYLSEAVQLLF